jgi:predicted N-acyltransferase
MPDRTYERRLLNSLNEVEADAWNDLVYALPGSNPFLSHAFLHALNASGCASDDTGWKPQFITLWQDQRLQAAMPLYMKEHSYGEYVFDWAWADAYHRHGLDYYPKLLSAIPFTPVTGSRLLARDRPAQEALIAALKEVQQEFGLSSTHILFPPSEEAQSLQDAGFLLRTGVQFHWLNKGYEDFDDFLATLEAKKRKNIRAERRKVKEAGIHFRHLSGHEAGEEHWAFFKHCYDRTYAEHRSTPYLNLDFFLRIGASLPDHILLVIAERENRPIAASLFFHDHKTLYGRYWGALEHHSCLHFEAAYYQGIDFCIEHRIPFFEGGAQGEHKLARGFEPQKTQSAHWLAHPAFSDAVAHFLERESNGIAHYICELNEHLPYRS